MENKPGTSVPKTKKPTMWEGVIEKSIIMLNDRHNQKRIQQFIVDPVLNHVRSKGFAGWVEALDDSVEF